MTYYAILDTNAGLLQWAGTAESEERALEKLSAVIGSDFSSDDLCVHKLTTRHQYRKVLKWWNDGGKSNDTPDCIRELTADQRAALE